MNYVSNTELKHSLGILETFFQIFPVLLEEICLLLSGLKVKMQSLSVLFGHFVQSWSIEDTDDQSNAWICSLNISSRDEKPRISSITPY